MEMAAVSDPRLDDRDLPGLWREADARALRSQAIYWRLLGSELTAVALAAVGYLAMRPFGAAIAAALGIRLDALRALGVSIDGGTATAAVGAAIVPAALMALAIAAAGLRFGLRPDAQWRGQRALAEAAASLAWRYSMGALPGDLAARASGALAAGAADGAYAQEYATLAQDAMFWALPPSDAGAPISDGMRCLREACDPAQKRVAYLRDRVARQRDFYTVRAGRYRARRDRLRVLMIVAYVAAVPLLVVNGLGAMTTVAGALGTWLASGHYEDLSQSYGHMGRKLDGRIAAADGLALSGPEAQAEWAQFVDRVEGLLEGEHRQWLATVMHSGR
jgi:hypothetical protein